MVTDMHYRTKENKADLSYSLLHWLYNLHHPLCGTPISNWVACLLLHSLPDIRLIPRAAIITMFSSAVSFLGAFAGLRYGSRIKRTPIDSSPVFIIGHWRSGTTYLHEVMSCDPSFVTPLLWQNVMPECFLVTNWLKRLYGKLLPSTRPMDQVSLSFDGCFEEEAAMAAMGQTSFYHCLYFPRDANRIFLKSVMGIGLTLRQKDRFKRQYLRFLRSVTYAAGGGRLLLKNPANTARIPLMLEMFPNARFIHIVRNPVAVFASAVQMRYRLLGPLGLHKSNINEVTHQVLREYPRLMKRYLQYRDQIPSGQLVEIRFEDFETNTLSEIQRIYQTLSLHLTSDSQMAMETFIGQKQRYYKKNNYVISDETLRMLHRKWLFAFEAFGYDLP